MAKIIQFPGSQEGLNARDARIAGNLVAFADRIDALIQESLSQDGVDEKEVAAVLAHRLGTLIRFLGTPLPGKGGGETVDLHQLHEVCRGILAKQVFRDSPREVSEISESSQEHDTPPDPESDLDQVPD